MTSVKSSFSLSDVTDLDPFEKLGKKLAANPDDELRRMQLGARIRTGADGMRSTELVTRTGASISSEASTIPLAESRERLVDAVVGAGIVPLRIGEDKAAERIVGAFVKGLGSDAERVLSAYLDRAAARLVSAITEEHRRFVAKPDYETVVEVSEFAPVRISRQETSTDRSGSFSRSVGYEGWQRSMFEQEWFDSSTERQLALILDSADEIRFWVRLQTGDLKILWQSDGREYNPDFVAIETGGTHWLVESKMNKEMENADVKGKENAAQRWANHVSDSPDVGVTWRYVLVSEDDIATAKGSWEALKKLSG